MIYRDINSPNDGRNKEKAAFINILKTYLISEKEDNMKKVVFTDSDDDDDDDDSGNIFSIEKKAEVEEKQEQEHNKVINIEH